MKRTTGFWVLTCMAAAALGQLRAEDAPAPAQARDTPQLEGMRVEVELKLDLASLFGLAATPKVKVQPADASVGKLFANAEAFRRQGDHLRARVCYEQVQQLSPGSELARRASERLRELDAAPGESVEESEPPTPQRPTRREPPLNESRRTIDRQPKAPEDTIPLGLVEFVY